MSSFTTTARVTFLIGLAIGLLLTSGCGSGPRNAYAYVTQVSNVMPGDITPPAGGIAQLHIADNGALTQIGQASLPSNRRPQIISIHPSGKFLLGEFSDGNTYEFSIKSDGTLSTNPTATIEPPAVGDGIGPVGYTANGRFVVMAGVNFTGCCNTTYTVSSYTLNSSGSPTLVNTLTLSHTPEGIVPDPSGKYLYVSSYENFISEYALSSSGALSFVKSISPNSTAGCSITISPMEFLYCVNNGYPLDTTIYSIDSSTGALNQSGSFPSEAALVFHPSGKYAYGVSGSVSQYTVDAQTGVLTQSGPVISGASGLTLDPTGKLALVFTDFDTVSSYTIGSDGLLTAKGTLALDQNFLAQRMAIARH